MHFLKFIICIIFKIMARCNVCLWISIYLISICLVDYIASEDRAEVNIRVSGACSPSKYFTIYIFCVILLCIKLFLANLK